MPTSSLDEFNAEAKRFAASLIPDNKATIVALSGDLGAGKTTFTQALAQHFEITEQVASPTFIIEKIYETPRGPFRRLVHIDAYRLKSAAELEALGWHEIVTDPHNLIIIEWPERVSGLIPARAHRIALAYTGENTREIVYGS